MRWGGGGGCINKENSQGTQSLRTRQKSAYFGKMLLAPAGRGGLGGGAPGEVLPRESGSKVNTVSLAVEALAASTLS